MARTAALFALGVLGGFSIGVRIVLFRSGLLVPSYVINWVVILVFGLLGFFLVVARQRVGIVSGLISCRFCVFGTDGLGFLLLDCVFSRCWDVFDRFGD